MLATTGGKKQSWFSCATFHMNNIFRFLLCIFIRRTKPKKTASSNAMDIDEDYETFVLNNFFAQTKGFDDDRHEEGEEYSEEQYDYYAIENI